MGGSAAQEKLLEVQSEQKLASREDLLQPKIYTETVFVTSLDRLVKLRSLSHGQRRELREECGFGTEAYDEDKAELLQVAFCVVDPKLTMDDMEALKEQEVGIIDELTLHIATMSMLGRAASLKKESSSMES